MVSVNADSVRLKSESQLETTIREVMPLSSCRIKLGGTIEEYYAPIRMMRIMFD